MPPKGRRSAKAKLQSQFKQKKSPKTYRYDPSLDSAPSWGESAETGPHRSRSRTLLRIDVTAHLVGRLV